MQFYTFVVTAIHAAVRKWKIELKSINCRGLLTCLITQRPYIVQQKKEFEIIWTFKGKIRSIYNTRDRLDSRMRHLRDKLEAHVRLHVDADIPTIVDIDCPIPLLYSLSIENQ
eukprot:scaffold27034_cov171-Amphora_coffeaeformis.AAC.1